jgi:uncharacterized membrane protein (UPF0127 family)
MKAKRRLYAAVLAACLCAQVSLAAAGETIALSVNDKIIRAELAQSAESRAKGLMFRNALCANCGMLFVFPFSDKWSFWSKNTPLALSVAFIDGAGRIVQIIDMEAESTEDHVSQFDALYALEMERGWFASHGIVAGHTIKGLAQPDAVR